MTKRLKLLNLVIIIMLILTSCNSTANPDLGGKSEAATTGQAITTKSGITTGKEGNIPQEKELTEEEKAQIELEKKLAERQELEEKRIQELGDFYVPLIPIGSEEDKKNLEAKGLYATGYTAAMSVNRENVNIYSEYVKALEANDTAKINELSSKANSFNKFERIIGIALSTEINAIVINVKNDDGIMTYKSNVEAVKKADANVRVSIKDIQALIELLDEYDIYTIARIVTFKDSNLAYNMPEHSIQLKTGGVWHDYSGTPWVNPFDKFVWDYNVAIAKEAALNGFDEIQFDYVRFPDNAKAYNPITDFPGRDGMNKDEGISNFVEYAKQQLAPYNVNIAADVFGLVTHNWDDYPEDIGQTWRLMAEHSDVMCPMIYPSHYGTQWYGFEYPDAHPYGVMSAAVQEAVERNAALEDSPEIRPWIQDFTATWVDGYIVYGPKQVREQIVASKELGVNGYLVWNPGNSYNPKSFIVTAEEKNTNYPLDRGDKDFMDRTPVDALEKYLYAEKNYDPNGHFKYKIMYLLTPINDRPKDFDEFVTLVKENNYKLSSYQIYGWEYTDNNSSTALIDLYYKYEVIKENGNEIIEADHVKWEAILENNIWKIRKVLDSE